MKSLRSEPPITITTDDERRLRALAELNASRFPRVALFLTQELDRADVVSEQSDMQNVVRMGSHVKYRDNATGHVRNVMLVYPDQADINLCRISVLAPVGVALIGLTVGQTIEFQTPIRENVR
jgi:regulator of nucleoside diphosphate kinase